MIGSVEVRCCAAQPQKPLAPCFVFKDSPQSFRILDVPKALGEWAITRVYVGLNYPDNTNVQKDATRQGNVWVATVDGCTIAGKTMGGFTIYADGTDEAGNAVEGYVLGNGDCYVLDKSEKISALVGKTTMRILDDIPATPSKGDVLVVGEELKIYNGEEWVTISGGSSEETYTKEEIDEMVEEIDSSIGELASSVSALGSSVSALGSSVIALDSSVSALDSSVSVLSASVSSFGEDLSVVNASVSSLTSSMTSLASQVTRLSSSMTSLASTKRDKTDRVWKYTRQTDTEMYGVQKFQVTNDTLSEYNELVDFNPQTKTWSVYEGTVSVVAYGSSLFAVIDENNPHTFIDDDEIERQGWPFYRTSDTNNSWTLTAGEYEYSVRAIPRADTSFALDSTVAEKRDYDDLTWDYPLEQDSDRFGVGNFNVDVNGSLFSLTQFSKTSQSRTWSQPDAGAQGRFEIYTSDGRHYNLLDKVDAKTMPFTRTGNDNVVWSIETGNNAYLVRAIRREQGRLALYEPDISNPDQVRIDFGSSGAGLMLGTNLSASTQAFVQIGDVMLTGNNYVSSRAATRGATKRDGSTPHLKVNGETVAFTSEIEGATSSIQSEISEVTASVSAMASSVGLLEEQTSALASRMGEVAASVETLGSSVSGLTASVSELGSSVSALASSVSAMASTVESVSTDVSALGSQVSAMTSSFATLESSVGAMGSQVSALASSMDDKRDYNDLTYGGTYDPTDAEGYYGITSWRIEGLKYNGQTWPAFNTTTKFKNNQTYGTGWNAGPQAIHTSPSNPSDFSTLYLDGFGNAEPVPFTLSLDKTTYEVSFMGTEQQNLTLTANLANADRLALNSQLSAYATTSALGSVSASVSALTSSIGVVTASISSMESDISTISANVSTMGSSISTLGSTVSALASSVSAKRDYDDLTYNTTVPSETIDNSRLDPWVGDPLYNAKLTFDVNDSVAGEEHLEWNDGENCWINEAMQDVQVWYAEAFGRDPSSGKFVLFDGMGDCLQFDLEDGVNEQTFNYESGNLESTGTLTMTFTGEPSYVVNDNLALDSNLSAVSASVSTLASSISNMASNFNVSGIGCSTIVLSGTYADSTSFAYNFVIQPSA